MKLEIISDSKHPPFSAHGESEPGVERLEPCPFCGSTDIVVENTHTPYYWGECQRCGAEGPTNSCRRETNRTRASVARQHRRAFARACELWNRRIKHPGRDDQW